ncbi:Acyl-CoA N-acyltransferases superfamily protein, partial [Prunus dulcis]
LGLGRVILKKSVRDRDSQTKSKASQKKENRERMELEVEGNSGNEEESDIIIGGGGKVNLSASEIEYVSYEGEDHLPLIMGLVLRVSVAAAVFSGIPQRQMRGTVVCKMGEHRNTYRGYIAMLVVIKPYRGKGIATQLVTRSIQVMMESGCEEVTLEAEVTNKGALALYGRLGFIRAKRLFRYYLNGVDAFRLKLLFPPRPDLLSQSQLLISSRAMPFNNKHPEKAPKSSAAVM